MRGRADRQGIDKFLVLLGKRLSFPVRLYLVGGSAVVDLGLRDSTLDVDYVVQSDDPRGREEFERLVPRMKNELQINLEPVSPSDFLPLPADIVGRSPYVRSYGNLHVYYFDLASSIISKAARGAERDLTDIETLVRSGAVQWDDVEARWREIKGSQVSWLRHDPISIAKRLAILRERLSEATPFAEIDPTKTTNFAEESDKANDLA